MDIEAQRGQVRVLLMVDSLEIAELGPESNCVPAGRFSAVTSTELMVAIIAFNSFPHVVFKKHPNCTKTLLIFYSPKSWADELYN